LLQTYVWQDYDMFPNFPALKDFLAFWQERLEGPLFSVTVAHSKLIKPAELRAVHHSGHRALIPATATDLEFDDKKRSLADQHQT
jgi:uncharacterized protein Usg